MTTIKTLAARMALLAVFLSIPVLSGCATPAQAHYEADRKFIDGSLKFLVKRMDEDATVPAEVKKLIHADVDVFEVDVRHAIEGK